MAVCALFLEKSERARDHTARPRYDPVAMLELLGHIPSERHRRDWMKCTLCGITWHKRNSRIVAQYGRCTTTSLYQYSVDDWTNLTPRPHWGVKAETKLIFNGSVVHQTHVIRWVRGVIFCGKCGHYSVAVMRNPP